MFARERNLKGVPCQIRRVWMEPLRRVVADEDKTDEYPYPPSVDLNHAAFAPEGSSRVGYNSILPAGPHPG